MTFTPSHNRWDEFCVKLSKRCRLKEKNGEVTWKCAGGEQKLGARAVLKQMGFSDTTIRDTFYYFELNGGFCDCEILFNVDR